MKKQVTKIIEFTKQNYKVLIPIILIIVLLLAFLIYRKEFQYNRYTKDDKYSFYQYFIATKYEYRATVTTDRNNLIKKITPIDIDINMDSIPLYFQDKNKIIFPAEMEIVFPTKSGNRYNILKNSILEYKDNNYYIQTKNYNNKLNYFFLYDYNNLYFFIDDVTLTIGSQKIYLSPMSYAIVDYNSTVEYYDKKNDKSEIIDITNEKVKVENEYLNINLSDDYLYYQNNIILLPQSSEYLATIDKIKED